MKHGIFVLILIFFAQIFGATNEQPPKNVEDVINYIVKFDKEFSAKTKLPNQDIYKKPLENLKNFLNFLIKDSKKVENEVFQDSKTLLKECHKRKYLSLILFGCNYLKIEDSLKNILKNTRKIDIDTFKNLKEELIYVAQNKLLTERINFQSWLPVTEYANILYGTEYGANDFNPYLSFMFQQIAFWCYNIDEEARKKQKRKKLEAKKAKDKIIKTSAKIGITTGILSALYYYFNKR